MAKRKNNTSKANTTGANLGFEAQLWATANTLRGSMDAAEYKHVVLGLVFLKYISDAFEAQHARLEAERDQGADPEDPDEYRAENIFWVPPEARWPELKKNARQPTIGQIVDDAMAAVGRDNPTLEIPNPRRALIETPDERHVAVVAHGERLPFADATFDCAVASEVIEHLPEPERVLDEMWRVVRPGGRVLISTPYRERIRYVLCIHCNQPTPIHAHLNSFDEHRLASYLRQGRFGYTTFGNKALLLARTHVLLGRVPHWLWRLVDRLANRILPKPAHIVAWWDRA
ncbi:MAG: type I restriction-modification system subunit M N-terminal domain-containing protein [Bryobacteraceae bacterium]|nr:type I restriction-modification system subunit M N-terminal domain-containing protein [Bryobacteraceae bacterium]